MSEVSEPFLDVSELNDSNVPYYGDMPDVSMAFPWSAWRTLRAKDKKDAPPWKRD